MNNLHLFCIYLLFCHIKIYISMVFVFDTQPLGVFLLLKTQLLLMSEVVIVEVDILVIVIVVTAVVVVVVFVVVVVVHE